MGFKTQDDHTSNGDTGNNCIRLSLIQFDDENFESFLLIMLMLPPCF